MWGAGSVWGWRRIPWAVLSLDLRLDQDLFYERARPHLTGIALDDGEKEGFGNKLIAIWRRFRAVLSRLFQSRRNALLCKPCKLCKLCKVLCKQKELMAILGDYLPSVHDWSIPILIRARQLNFNEWAIRLQKEWHRSVGDTRRNQEYFSSNTCDLWPCDFFVF